MEWTRVKPLKKYRLLPDDWSPKEIGTLVYATDGDRILLIEKLRGHGAGLINAPGGRLEHGETIGECAIREIWEEVGITVSTLSLRGILRFHDIVTSRSYHPIKICIPVHYNYNNVTCIPIANFLVVLSYS